MLDPVATPQFTLLSTYSCEKLMSEKTACCDHKHNQHHQHTHHQPHSHSHAHEEAAATSPAVETIALPAHASKLRLKIEQMDCPTEEALIRKALSSQNGILALEFDLLNRVLSVHHETADLAEIKRRLAGTGMQAVVLDANNGNNGGHAQALSVSASSSHGWQKYWRIAVGGLAAIAAEVLAWYSGDENSWMIAALAITTIILSGLPTLKKGWIALRHVSLNIHLLMTAAVIGATAIGQWPEAAMVIWLFAIAELIEAASLSRARDIINGLRSQAPESTQLLQDDGNWQTVATSSVVAGQTIQIRPGDRIALDGVILTGRSSINEAAITGESMPVEKNTGELVYAGSLNQTAAIQIKVTAPQSSTMLARIAESVQAAQGQRAPTQRFVDRFAAIYTPVVFVIAILVAVLPPLLWGYGWHESLYRALVLLVIACPCALVISTPVTVVSGLALAARRGIVIKGGVYLEQARHLKTIAFDKTGTLTEGKPQLTGVVGTSADPLLTSEVLLQLAASLDTHSSHPLALALLAACKTPLLPVTESALFETGRGRGVAGRLEGQLYQLGNQAMWQALQTNPELETQRASWLAQLYQLEAAGNTVLFLCRDGDLLGLLALADQVREHSRTALAALQAQGIRTVMLTGDNAQTAAAVAAQTGISEYQSQMLPTEKLAAIQKYAATGLTGMCGDGINDAPALARADIGFAMAAGSDTALETADVAFMQDDLRKLPELIAISRRSAQILMQNISFALLVKFVFFGLALSGNASLWMAVFADAGTSVLVVLNGLRLLKSKTPAV